MAHHRLDDITPLSWAPVTSADLPDLADLIAVIEHFDDALERQGLDDLEHHFSRDGAEPEFTTLLGRDRGGSAAAWAWNRRVVDDRRPARVWLRGGIHPVWRGQQIGRHLFDWQLQRAREWFNRDFTAADGPLRLIAYADQKLPSHQKLLEAAAMQPQRWFVDMLRAPLGAIATPNCPDGLRLVRLSEPLYEGARAAHNEAFEREWGSKPIPADAWRHTLERSAARPEWSWVAVDDAHPDQVVGYAICSEFDGPDGPGGWIDHLGVRHSWRGRGVATAVVTACLQTFAEIGLGSAGLGVDVADPENALGLYQRLGYEAADTMIMYVRDEESADGRSLQVGNH